MADTMVIDSDTSASATFTNGVPLTSLAINGYLYFISSDMGVQQWATNSVGATLSNPLSATALDSDVTCSFEGGCLVAITQGGLMTNLVGNPSKNNIKICGQLCPIVTT